MTALLHFFLELCLLRKKPQDLPPSPVLLGLTVVTNIIASLLLISRTELPIVTVISQSVLDTVLMLLVLMVALRFLRLAGRFTQSATALLGSGTLLGLVAWALFGLAGGSGQGGGDALAALLLLILVGWSMLVLGHILRHTFDIGLPVGVAAGVLYTLLSYGLISILFPIG